MFDDCRRSPATEISLTGLEFHPVPLFVFDQIPPSLPLGVFHAQLPFFSPRPSYITANFRPTLETFEQLLVFERPPCFIIRILSLSLSSHSSIRESLAVPIRGRNLGRFIASVSDTVVIFTPGITFKGYICITEKLGKWGNWGISGGLIYCGVMKSFMEVSRGVVRIFPLPIFKKEIFVLRNTSFF